QARRGGVHRFERRLGAGRCSVDVRWGQWGRLVAGAPRAVEGNEPGHLARPQTLSGRRVLADLARRQPPPDSLPRAREHLSDCVGSLGAPRLIEAAGYLAARLSTTMLLAAASLAAASVRSSAARASGSAGTRWPSWPADLHGCDLI